MTQCDAALCTTVFDSTVSTTLSGSEIYVAQNSARKIAVPAGCSRMHAKVERERHTTS